jgi:hypothetical protein
MRAHADLSIAADLHTRQHMLDIGNELAAAQHDGVIDEGGASFDSNHLLWKVLCLLCIKGHLFALVEKRPRIVDEAVALFAGVSSPSCSSSSLSPLSRFIGLV